MEPTAATAAAIEDTVVRPRSPQTIPALALARTEREIANAVDNGVRRAATELVHESWRAADAAYRVPEGPARTGWLIHAWMAAGRAKWLRMLLAESVG